MKPQFRRIAEPTTLWRTLLLLLILALTSSAALAQGGELRLCLNAEPKTLNPLLVQDNESESVRYLTGGVLVRMNRVTQKPQPELATEGPGRRQAHSLHIA